MHDFRGYRDGLPTRPLKMPEVDTVAHCGGVGGDLIRTLDRTARRVELRAGKLMTLEVGIRFLTDFPEGDVYFKTHRDGQNLDRWLETRVCDGCEPLRFLIPPDAMEAACRADKGTQVSIKCGRHHLVSKPLVGNYPNYKQVIPASAQELAVVPHDRKPGLIA